MGPVGGHDLDAPVAGELGPAAAQDLGVAGPEPRDLDDKGAFSDIILPGFTRFCEVLRLPVNRLGQTF